jgi:hypothetical protein
METHDDHELGPVDILAIGYPVGAPMTGEAMPIFLDLVERGIIRVLDALFVLKAEDGSVSGFNADDLDVQDVGDFEALRGASSGLLGGDDVDTAGEALDPGSAAVLIVYENRWAAPFATAVRRNGGVMLASERIPVQDVVNALDAAEAAV